MRILLPVDDSQYSNKAVRAVVEQVRPAGVEIQVLHVIEPISGYISADYYPHLVPYLAEVEKDRRKQAESLVDGVCSKLHEAGFRCTKIVTTGDPKSIILDAAAEWNADLIVVGSHGLKGLNRWLMGSVSEAVTRHAPCSVQVVRIKPAAA